FATCPNLQEPGVEIFFPFFPNLGSCLSALLSIIEHMFAKVGKAIDLLKQAVDALDSDVLDPKFAVELVQVFTQGEKLCGAGKALAARRVASSGTWQEGGDRSAAHFIAKQTGDSVSSSISLIETAERMRDLSKTEEAFRAGQLTQAQAAEIASAASVVPKQEQSLIALAQNEGIEKLKAECRSVMAQACTDEAEKAERLHRSRYVRTWTDQEGAFRLEAKLTPEAGAEVRSVLDVLRDDQYRQARRQGRIEPTQALEADAFLQMARAARDEGGSSVKTGAKAVVNVTVDIAALTRGHTENGEVCEVSGVGPISVAAARDFMTDSFIKVLFTRQGKILEVAHPGPYIPSAVKTAVVQTYPECAIKGCRETKGLEMDHMQARGKLGLTEVKNLIRLCSHHHDLKTYKRYELKKVKGDWILIPPNEARASPSL
ncbi:MAG: DUF222 domain-containing protein, partial [Acidimicrobiia bacterium]